MATETQQLDPIYDPYPIELAGEAQVIEQNMVQRLQQGGMAYDVPVALTDYRRVACAVLLAVAHSTIPQMPTVRFLVRTLEHRAATILENCERARDVLRKRLGEEFDTEQLNYHRAERQRVAMEQHA